MTPCVEEEPDEEDIADEGIPTMLGRLANISATCCKVSKET